MPDGSSYGQIETSSCSARVRATPEEVREASLLWARDLGWILGRDADSLLVFRFSRFSRWFGGPEIEVFFEEQDGAVFVSFTASQAITVAGQRADLGRAARHFGSGVCSYLQERGAGIDSQWFGFDDSEHSREHLIAVEKWRRRAQRTILVLLAPALGAALWADRSLGLFWAVWLCLFGLLAILVMVRYRTIGMEARVVVSALRFGLPFCFALSVVLILGYAGVF
jgi:hypothetical protein